MSLPLDAPPATTETATRKERRNASILTLTAERLKQASHLARALPPDWRDGAVLPMSAIEDIARELRVLVQVLAPRRQA
jgi:hypothetical protein